MRTWEVPLRHQNFRTMSQNVCEAPDNFLIVLRDPVDRIVSTYRHLFRSPKTFPHLSVENAWRRYTISMYIENVRRYFDGALSIHGNVAYDPKDPGLPVLDRRHVEKLSWWLEGLPLGSRLITLNFSSLEDDYKKHVSWLSGVYHLSHYNKAPVRFRRRLDVTLSAGDAAVLKSLYEADEELLEKYRSCLT